MLFVVGTFVLSYADLAFLSIVSYLLPVLTSSPAESVHASYANDEVGSNHQVRGSNVKETSNESFTSLHIKLEFAFTPTLPLLIAVFRNLGTAALT